MKRSKHSFVDTEMNQWSKLYGRPISTEEYREICQNLKDFFDLLNKLDKAQKPKNR